MRVWSSPAAKLLAGPKLDWTCLVTNDGGYLPLVEHLYSRGKAVYLLSLGDPKGQSRDLRNAVGAEYLINKVEFYSGFRKEPVPEPYRSKSALIFLLTRCVVVKLGTMLGDEAEFLCDQ
jgi:hypothetical protein